jgi:hypothetical protein
VTRQSDGIAALFVVTFLNIFAGCGAVWLVGMNVGGLLGAGVCYCAIDAAVEMWKDMQMIRQGQSAGPS